ncbi:Translin [Panaeolus papilionaceus]|nr:Translin [Panaeolus papilionaceus]
MDPQLLDDLNNLLDKEVEIREKIREQVNELDKKARTMVGLLNQIHATPPDAIPTLLSSVRPHLSGVKNVTLALSEIVPQNQFWRWKDMWTNSLRTIVFCAALTEYLETRTLISLPDAANIIGVRDEWSDRISLPVEDYLHALISLVNELSRLAINSVTLGNFEEPLKISKFVKDLFAGFSMLNLKNDLLRRRYDSLKYDIKKIEEVVYDVSLRKLAPSIVPRAI